MSNRAAKYELLYKSLKKNFKPIPEVGERTVLEHLIYACCLEDARADQADEAFAKLQQAYFDWNEVRVTTVIELGEALNSLPNATQAGHRIKRCLQSLFETRYQYDIEDMKKANLGKATDELTAWKGVSPFILNYVSQNALGGHAIPADTITLDVLVQADVITASEAEKKSLPGVERAISKSKGFEFASLLHQFAVEFHQNPKSINALAVFKDLGIVPKAKPAEKPAAAKEVKAKPASPAPVAEPAPAPSKGKAAAAESGAPEAATAKKSDKAPAPQAKGKEAIPAKAPLKAEAEKVAAKKKAESAPEDAKKASAKKEPPAKPSEKPAVKKTTEKAPAAKPAAKKPEAKPADAKKTTKSSPPKPAADAKAKPATKPAGDKPATNVKITKKKPR
jgi:endonuclease III